MELIDITVKSKIREFKAEYYFPWREQTIKLPAEIYFNHIKMEVPLRNRKYVSMLGMMVRDSNL
jgi:hypothetical protein